jgi:hypothetical protein
MSRTDLSGGTSWFLPVVVFCLVAIAQLGVVAAAGTDIPFQDQWDVEGRGLYPAWREGLFRGVDLWRAHNEHRIFWTQALNLGLFRLNGQWDPLVQLAVGALLHAAGAALLAALLARGADGLGRWLLGLAVVLLCLPLAGWHNALWGFQSQIYFALLFSFAAYALLARSVISPAQAIAGWLAVIAAMLAMGPGLLVPVALAGGRALRWRENGGIRWREVVPLAVLLVVAWSLHQRVPEHAALQANSSRQFFSALVRLLAWPHSDQPWAVLVLNIPLLVIVGGRLWQRRAAAKGEDVVTLLAGWALTVALAAAWARGGSGEFAAGVPSRYVDFVMLLPLANVWCAMVLAQEVVFRWRASVRLVAAAWGVFLFAGWLGLSVQALRGVILPRGRDRDAPVRLMREFQRANDAEVFTRQPKLLVPHPDLDSVRGVLRDPWMQGALPPSLQPDKPLGPLSRAVRALLRR